jgi:hypothetical protein
MLWSGGDIDVLLRVGLVIVEFHGGDFRVVVAMDRAAMRSRFGEWMYLLP